MNSQMQFYNEARANKGVKRDVRDVVGELTRLNNKNQLKSQIDLAKITKQSKAAPAAKQSDVKGTAPVKRNLRNRAPTEDYPTVSYMDCSSEEGAMSEEEEEEEDVVVTTIQPPKKKSKKDLKSVTENERKKVPVSSASQSFILTNNGNSQKSEREESLERALLEQTEWNKKSDEKTQKLEKMLEESKQLLVLALKNQNNKSIEHDNAVSTKPMSIVNEDAATKPNIQDSANHGFNVFLWQSSCYEFTPEYSSECT